MENDYMDWKDESLERKLAELNEIDQPWQSQSGRERVQREKRHVSFELGQRAIQRLVEWQDGTI